MLDKNRIAISEVDLSIIIVNWNVADSLKNCLTSIYKYIKSHSKEIIIVDNASPDNSVAMIKDNFKDIILIENKKNKGFATACNQGIKTSRGKYVLLLNPDTEIKEGIEKIISFLDKEKNIGVVSCVLLDEKGQRTISYQSFPTIVRTFTFFSGFNKFFRQPFVSRILQPVFQLFPSQCKHLERINKVEEVDCVTGAFFLAKSELYAKIGLFDENYFMYFEETDLCLRAKKAGYKNYFFPRYSILHSGGKSAKKTNFNYLKLYADSLLYYFRKNHSFLCFLLVRIILFFSVSLKILTASLFYFGVDKKEMLKSYFRILNVN